MQGNNTLTFSTQSTNAQNTSQSTATPGIDFSAEVSQLIIDVNSDLNNSAQELGSKIKNAMEETVTEVGKGIGEALEHAIIVTLKVIFAGFLAYMGKIQDPKSITYEGIKEDFHHFITQFAKNAFKKNLAQQATEAENSANSVTAEDYALADQIGAKINFSYLHKLWTSKKEFFSQITKHASKANFSDEVIKEIMDKNHAKLLDISGLTFVAGNSHSFQAWLLWGGVKLIGHKYLSYGDEQDNSLAYDIFINNEELGCNILSAFLKDFANHNLQAKPKFNAN